MDKKNDRGVVSAEEDWPVILQHLPSSWDTQAFETGAMRRVREFKNPEALLRTLLVHLAEGYSLRETAVRVRQGGIADVSDVAIMKRLRASEEWLRWMAFELTACHDNSALQSVGDRLRVRITDATNVSEPGKTGSDWRLHYSMELKTLRCDFFELTDVRGGETFTRIPVKAGDLILGDRGYESVKGVNHVVERGGEVLVRMKAANGMPLETYAGRRFHVLRRVRRLRVRQTGQWPVEVATGDGRRIGGRVCALRRSAAAAALAERKLRQRCSKSCREPKAAALEATQYVFVFTTINEKLLAPEEVMELYRGRWQIETCFKRLKSVIGLGHLPKHDKQSSRAWLYGKLLVALLAERLVNEARLFSPWGYALQER